MKFGKNIGIVLVAVFSCMGLFVSGLALLNMVEDFWAFPDRRPSGNIATIEDLMAWRQPTGDVLRLSVNGCTYYMIKDRFPSLLIYTTSAFVFDCRGTLVAWTPHIGDPDVGIISHFVELKPEKIVLSQLMDEIRQQRESSKKKLGDNSVKTEGKSHRVRQETR